MITLFIYLAVCIYLMFGTMSRGLTSARLDLNEIEKAKGEGRTWYVDCHGDYRTCNGNKLLASRNIEGDECLVLPETGTIIHNFKAARYKQGNRNKIAFAIQNGKRGYHVSICNIDRARLFPGSGDKKIYQMLDADGKPTTTFYIPSCREKWLFFDIPTKTWKEKTVSNKDRIKMV